MTMTLAQAHADLEEKRRRMRMLYESLIDASANVVNATSPYTQREMRAEMLRAEEAWEQSRAAVREARIVVDRIAGALARAS